MRNASLGPAPGSLALIEGGAQLVSNLNRKSSNASTETPHVPFEEEQAPRARRAAPGQSRHLPELRRAGDAASRVPPLRIVPGPRTGAGRGVKPPRAWCNRESRA